MRKTSETESQRSNEKSRLNKLYEYDLIEECGREKFEKIARMASRYCDTDYAGIHFIDDKTQQCKISYGLELKDMPRTDSVCQYVIISEEPLVVTDLGNDERFHDKSYVKNTPHFASYAGVPIKTPEGYKIGSLCVLDTETRNFTNDQVEALELLAEEIITRLELYLRNKQLRDKNKQVEEYAQNRDAIIKEIHHRLKNNLSYIIGILDLELMNNEDAHVQQLIKKIQKRIMSVAAIHQRLYESETVEKLDLKSYLKVLCDDISQSFTDEAKQVECRVIGDELSLSNKQMTPFGLLMSELLMNSFKHAFEGRENGRITIELLNQEGQHRVDIKDDGVGLPEDFTLHDTESMGSQLIVTFLEQLGADIDWESNNGTRFTITFDPEP